MAVVPVLSGLMVRLDDRQSTFGNTSYFECAPDVVVLPPSRPVKYGTAIVGLTSTGDINGPLIMRTMPVYAFGVHLHISQLFPSGLPDGYAGLLWDVWFVPAIVGFDLLVGGVRA